MKTLTGQMIYEALFKTWPDVFMWTEWSECPRSCTDRYNEAAQALNQELGIVEDHEISVDQAIGKLKELGYMYLPQSYAGTPVQWKVFKSLDGKLETCHDDQSVFDLLNTLQGGLS